MAAPTRAAILVYGSFLNSLKLYLTAYPHSGINIFPFYFRFTINVTIL